MRRSFWAPLIRKYARSRGRYRQFSRSDPSKLPIDIVIPLAPKDLPVFKLCLAGLRENLLHPINGVHVIAPRDSDLEGACAETECNFVDERELLPEGPEFYVERLAHMRIKRGKWMFQQFLKLQAGQHLGLKHFLIYDSDTVLINPFKYETGGKFILEYSDGYRGELDDLHERLVRGLRLQPYSFMCHAMLMETRLMKQLLQAIEQSTSMDWKTAILEHMDTSEDLCFSEYELYGNFACDKIRNPAQDRTLAYWFNKAYPRAQVPELESLKAVSRKTCRSLSFHSYNK
jgi:hypothetical protein